MFVYHNDEKYDPNEYDKRPVISKLKEEIFGLTSAGNTVLMQIQQHDVESEEQMFGLGFPWQQSNESFTTIERGRSEKEDDDKHIVALIFGLNLAKVTNTRSIFTFWDFLADVGGLYDMLIVIGGWVLSIIQLVSGSGLNRFIFNQVFSFKKRKKIEVEHLTLLERIKIELK